MTACYIQIGTIETRRKTDVFRSSAAIVNSLYKVSA